MRHPRTEPRLTPEIEGSDRPRVALETSVLAQGLPPPRNREAALRIDGAVRESGALPGWTWIEGGEVRVGASAGDLDRLCAEPAAKVARRDLPMAVGRRGLGATTVSATLWIAARAGIEVAATGGIGGVHPRPADASPAHDVSADLAELARTPITLVCSGPKSITDPEATMERLEELGVGVVGFGTERLPFFLAREAPIELEHRADTPKEAAAMARARRDLGIESAMLICVPVPEAVALDPAEVAQAVRRCEERASSRGVGGKELTPFLLTCLAEETGGRSLQANLALLEENARIAGAIAAAL